MTTLLRMCTALTLLVPAMISAQWEPHPDKRIPRNADGTPNLEAPAPRAADGKPDLSGVWQGFGTLGGTAAQPEPEGTIPRAGFANVGQNIKDGLPLRPEYEALADQRRESGGKDNPEATCLPMGIMQFHTQGAPRKFIQTPDVLVILYEASMGIRQIFTDGREFPVDDWLHGAARVVNRRGVSPLTPAGLAYPSSDNVRAGRFVMAVVLRFAPLHGGDA